jgi:uncharacterized protein (TIGR03086 family)
VVSVLPWTRSGLREIVIVMTDSLGLLEQSLSSVGSLIDSVVPEQWGLATPCSDWAVRDVVRHVDGMNRVFAAMLAGGAPPARGEAPTDDALASAYRQSAAQLLDAFRAPGVLEHSFESPMGSATGGERLLIRLYDLLAHGWDIARATGQRPAALPEEAAELALVFAREQVKEDARPGRFAPVQPVAADAPAIEQLVAFLGRSVVEKAC